MRYSRKRNASLLAFLIYQFCVVNCSTQTGQQQQEYGKSRKSTTTTSDTDDNNNEDLKEQTKNVRNYELINPAIYNAGDLNGNGVSASIININAFGMNYNLIVENKKTRSSYRTLVEYYGKNNTYEAKYLRDHECFVSGLVNTTDGEQVEVTLNYCNGIEGMIQSTESLLFIEPIKISNSQKKTIIQKHIVYKGEDVQLNFEKDVFEDGKDGNPFKKKTRGGDSTRKRERRAAKVNPYQSYLTFINRSGRTVQLYYLDTFNSHIPFITFVVQEKRNVNTYRGTTWIAKDDQSDQILYLNGKRELVAQKNSESKRMTITITKPDSFKEDNNVGDGELTNSVGGDHHYIEVLVVADLSVIRFHGKDKIEKYILTMMDIAARVFKHKSLGMMIHFQVVRIVLIEDNYTGFEVYTKNPTRTLRSACEFISSLQSSDENDRDHFDFGIALSREDFGPSGFAQLYSMCSSSRSCALVQDEGLTSAFIVAHETGHLLGLEHDGEGEASRCTNEGPRGSIMAPVIVARYDRYRWSTCSREVLKENLEYFQCLKNTPRQRYKIRMRNQGALYSLAEQCEFNFGKDFTTCTSFKYNPCRILWCKRAGSRSYCKTMRGPALEGTICGQNKHCEKGECVKFDNERHFSPLALDRTVKKEEPKTVDGYWGYWSKWTSCSKTCHVGIRSRRRKCDNPSPSPDGKKCTGKKVQREVCNTKQCDVKLLITRQIEQCQGVHGEDWTVYTDNDFNAKLWQQRSNPNCTFETGEMCNWKNDPENDIHWEVNNGATQSYNTGPSMDHTLKSSKGKYIYVEASGTRRHPKKQGHKARLISEAISVPRACFTLHYHMFGKDMGKLQIKVKHKNNSVISVWEDSGNKGDSWRKAQISVESVDSYRLILEAERGQHWASDIAVDDITAVTGFCSPSKKPTTRGSCKISCRTRDASEFRMNVNVTDGTECGGRRSSNICIEGECVKFGCDNKFGSKLEIDECGVCGGNGSRCLKVVSAKTKIRPSKDYEILLSLEKGSTFIDILLEYSAAKYYYFFRTKHNNSLKMITKAEVVAMAANSAFHFTKHGNKQRIISDGPLSNPVDLIIFTDPKDRKDQHVDVNYEYYRPVDSEFTYTYVNKGWSKCSVSCGTGEQKTLVACIREQDKIVVDKSYCAGVVIPMYIRACRLKECPEQYRWLSRPWKACTRTCGGGVKIRLIQCIHVPTLNVVLEKFCRSLNTPTVREYCNNNPCPKWQASKWKSCSVSCGSGIQLRDVTCVDPASRKALANEKCPIQQKPDTVYPCNNQPCERYIYIIYEQGLGCTATCGGGKRVQIVKCVKNSTREEVDKIFCNGPSPPIFADCNMHPCPEFKWEVLKQSPCTSTCGNGTIVRDVACVNMDTDKSSDESNCHGKKPAEFLNCFEKTCPNVHWKVHESSPCSKTCGNGTKTRELACVEILTGKRASDTDCPKEKLPPSTIPCFVKACIEYEVRYSEWGKCSVTCGNGIQRRTFSCHEKQSGRQMNKKTCIKKRIKLEQKCTSTLECKQVDKLLCSFDNRNFCNWNNMKSNDFNWSIEKKTPSVYTGPDYDHTTKQGYFAFIEASLPRKKGEKARLYSPYLQVEKGCFSFWYHMRGEGDMGRLRVLLSTSSQDELIFEKNGHQGTYWLQAKINIVKKSRYRLIIEATRGSGVYSDAAIDDLAFQNKDCDNNYKKRIQTVRPTLNCREISPYCNHRYREQYCKGSPAYRNLCCKTCPKLLNSKKPNVTVVAFAKIKN